MTARSIECRCDASFTCGYCLRNAKPYLFTPRTAQQAMHDAIHAVIDAKVTEEQRERDKRQGATT